MPIIMSSDADSEEEVSNNLLINVLTWFLTVGRVKI